MNKWLKTDTISTKAHLRGGIRLGKMRKHLLSSGEVYHVLTKSIAQFVIFNNDDESLRVLEVILYYQREKPEIKFSKFIKLEEDIRFNKKNLLSKKEKLVEIIAYCIMPTHIHLILKQQIQNGISKFMNNILNSYTRYFNIKHKRKGPLWEARFKNILVETDEYLLHLTRYIHLNPVTGHLVNKPENWIRSSYNEYLSKSDNNKICKYKDILNIRPVSYKKFVKDRVSYQRGLAKIKHLLLED